MMICASRNMCHHLDGNASPQSAAGSGDADGSRYVRARKANTSLQTHEQRPEKALLVKGIDWFERDGAPASRTVIVSCTATDPVFESQQSGTRAIAGITAECYSRRAKCRIDIRPRYRDLIELKVARSSSGRLLLVLIEASNLSSYRVRSLSPMPV